MPIWGPNLVLGHPSATNMITCSGLCSRLILFIVDHFEALHRCETLCYWDGLYLYWWRRAEKPQLPPTLVYWSYGFYTLSNLYISFPICLPYWGEWRHNGHFADAISVWIFFYDLFLFFYFVTNSLLKYVHKSPNKNMPVLAQIMNWHQMYEKPLIKPVMV